MVGGNVADERWDFFVSYTQADRAWAEWIAWQLEEDRYRVLIQAWDMVPSTDWIHLIQQGVRQATRTIAVLSAAYLESVFATAEWEAAWRGDPLGEQRKLLLFRVADCDRPGLLAGVVSTDLSGLDEAVARGQVKAAARAAVTGRAKPETEPVFPPAGRVVRGKPRFPGSPPEIWNVPPRNPNFTGRAADLGRIREGLAGQPAMTVHALHGMGGVGKTQAAIEYAYRYVDDYDLVWWVNAEQATLTGEQLARLAEQMGLPPLADPEAMMAAVRRALRTRDRWLLIFDNAEDAHQIRPLLPGGAGHVLITTRRGGFRSLGGVMDLDILNRAEAIDLLRRRVPDLADDQAEQLAERLGDLPLALDQAAAYLDQTGMAPQEYLDLLGTRSADLHSRGHSSGHPDTVATVWSVSLDRLQATAPAAVQLLQLCAWLAPEPIPLDLFTGHSGLLPEPLASAAADPVAFNDAAGALVDYSLARRTAGTLIVHRLIQDVTRQTSVDWPRTVINEPLSTVLAVLHADLPSQIWASPSRWQRWRALLPSVLAATGHQADATGEAAGAWLLAHAGTYIHSQGRPAEALLLHERALRIHEAVYGPDHPDVALDLNGVGLVLSALGRPADALPLHERALRIHEAVYGPDHPDVAFDLNDVGVALSALGRPTEALALHQKALRIHEAAHGPDHPEVGADLNYVGRALLELGRPAEALPLQERALRIHEASFGLDDPDVATDLNLLGQALSDLGRSTDALPVQERALRIDEAVYGPDHPQVSGDLNLLGRALSDLGRPAEALSIHRRALRIDEATYGPDHPSTCQSRRYVEQLKLSP
jgi:tetratricopeptide (TPR) repeat protein